MEPLRALAMTFALSSPFVCPSTLWTMCWSVHQYQKPMMEAPMNTT